MVAARDAVAALSGTRLDRFSAEAPIFPKHPLKWPGWFNASGTNHTSSSLVKSPDL